MANLNVNYGGLKMRNPIGIEPLNPAIAYGRDPKVQADWLMRHVDAGAGYVFVSATRPERSNPANEAKPAAKFIKAQCPGFAKREGLYATGDQSAVQFYLDKTLEVMSIIKKQLPDDVPMIVQPHVPGTDVNAWIKLCKLFEQEGADALELNVACPISLIGGEGDGDSDKMEFDTLAVRTLKKFGLAPGMGEVPEVLSSITKACVNAVKIPVGVKPSAEVGFPLNVAIAKVLAEAGSAWVCNITSTITMVPPNIYEGGKSPWEKVNFPINPISVIMGPTDRFMCYKATGTVALFVPEIDIRAVGGIVNPEHCVELLMMGARAIGLSSGFFWKGRKLITDSVEFLNRFMDEQGYENLEDFKGMGLQYVRPIDDSIDWEEDKITCRVDEDKCSKCGVCSDSFCPVPIKGDSGFPVIDEVNCQGCGCCVAICPTNALSIVRL